MSHSGDVGSGLGPVGLLGHLESELAGKTTLCGDEVTLGDITVASVLPNYMHAGESIESTSQPSIRAFLDGTFARPSFARRIEEDLTSLSGLSTLGA